MVQRDENDNTPLQAELFEVWEGLATMRGVALTHSTPHPDHGHLTDLGKLLQHDISNIIDKIGALEARAEAAEQRARELEERDRVIEAAIMGVRESAEAAVKADPYSTDALAFLQGVVAVQLRIAERI